MLRVASEFGLKARARKSAWSRLPNTPLPAIAALKGGGFMLLGKVCEDKVLVQSPSSPRSVLMTQAEFEAVWDGQLVLITRRAGLIDQRCAKEFGLKARERIFPDAHSRELKGGVHALRRVHE